MALEVGGDIPVEGRCRKCRGVRRGRQFRNGTYDGKGKLVKMPYWSVPEEAFDDPDDMARWVRLAYEAAFAG